VPLPEDPDHRRFAIWAGLIRWIGKLLCRIRTSPVDLPEAHGRPIVMIANHRSLADVFISIDALNRYEARARCLVRAQYFETPVLGRWLRAVHCIPAGDGKGGSVDEALDCLATGRPVAVMVEGRITPPDERDEQGLGPFRPGFITIARQAGAVIMPIGIVGADHVWPSRARLPRLHLRRPEVHVSIGETIVIDEMTDDEVMATSRQAVADLLAAAA